MNQQNLTIKEIVETEGWKTFMKKIELMGAALLGVSLVMLIAGYTKKEFNLILILALMTLAVRSFFICYENFKSESKLLTYAFYKIYGLGLSIGFISLLFIKQNWHFPKEIMSSISLILVLISLYLGFKEKTGENINKLNWKYFLRLFVVLVPLAYAVMANYKI